jgi:hypothetical protein
MWDTTAVNRQPCGPNSNEVEIRGIPHLAKNQRDVGHPSSVTDLAVKNLNGLLSCGTKFHASSVSAQDPEDATLDCNLRKWNVDGFHLGI